MSLSKTVALTALAFVVILSAGHALAQKRTTPKKPPPCVVKPVMTDAQIQACRVARRR